MKEMSVAEQRYKTILAVIADGRTVSEVASDCGVCRRTMHRWLAHYEAEGLEGLSDRSHRPVYCPHQMSATVEAMVRGRSRRGRVRLRRRGCCWALGHREAGRSGSPAARAASRAGARARRGPAGSSP